MVVVLWLCVALAASQGSDLDLRSLFLQEDLDLLAEKYTAPIYKYVDVKALADAAETDQSVRFRCILFHTNLKSVLQGSRAPIIPRRVYLWEQGRVPYQMASEFSKFFLAALRRISC